MAPTDLKQVPMPLRVVFIITGLGTGGAESMLEKLIGALAPSIQAHVISLTTLGDIGPRLLARGVPVEALGMRANRPDVAAFARLVRRLRRLSPHVIHTWMYHADLFGGLAARLAGVRAVMWGVRHSNLSATANKSSTLAVMRVCARLSRWVPMRIACAAARARDVHVAQGYAADRMVVIPNGFDLSRFQPDASARDSLRAELGLARGTPLLGVVGRFDVQKNHRGFCEAMAILHARRPDVHAVLAGTGIDTGNAKLLAWMNASGIEPVCHLLGRRDDMPRLMAALDVLVLPSIGEAFPNVLGEAMACGVPCVSTDVGDARDILGSVGRVVAAGDMAGLAAAIEEVLTLPETQRRRFTQELPALVRRRFEIGAIAIRYEQEYWALARGAPASALQADAWN
jgi:glycosyltransferase involved in cell wall biosynthesis